MMDDMKSASAGLVARMRLARRAADALLPQEDDVLVEAVASGDPLAGPTHQGVPQADYVVTALDLRIGVALLPGRAREALDDETVLAGANRFLWANPNTMVCVLVADDEPLTCRIVEYGDTNHHSSAMRPSGMRGPLRSTLAAYLRTIRPAWPRPPDLADGSTVDYSQIADEASRQALNDQKRKGGRIRERTDAREALDEQVAHWAAQLAIDVVTGQNVASASALDASDREDTTK